MKENYQQDGDGPQALHVGPELPIPWGSPRLIARLQKAKISLGCGRCRGVPRIALIRDRHGTDANLRQGSLAIGRENFPTVVTTPLNHG